MSIKDAIKRARNSNQPEDVRGYIIEMMRSLIEGRFADFTEEISQRFAELKAALPAQMRDAVYAYIEGNLTPEQFKGDKGDDGDAYTLTDLDKEEIAGLIDVPIVEKIIEKTGIVREQPIVTN